MFQKFSQNNKIDSKPVEKVSLFGQVETKTEAVLVKTPEVRIVTRSLSKDKKEIAIHIPNLKKRVVKAESKKVVKANKKRGKRIVDDQTYFTESQAKIDILSEKLRTAKEDGLNVK